MPDSLSSHPPMITSDQHQHAIANSSSLTEHRQFTAPGFDAVATEVLPQLSHHYTAITTKALPQSIPSHQYFHSNSRRPYHYGSVSIREVFLISLLILIVLISVLVIHHSHTNIFNNQILIIS